MLKDFLIRFIGVEEQKADDTACRMEHAMDTSTFKKFQAFIQSMDDCPTGKTVSPAIGFKSKGQPEKQQLRSAPSAFF